MKKEVFLLFLVFMVFGIALHTPLVFGDEGNSNSQNNSNSSGTNYTIKTEVNLATNDNHENEDDENDSDEDKNKSDDENSSDSDENKSGRIDDGRIWKENRTREITREILTEGNCTIKIERKIEVKEGKRVEVIKKKIDCIDGTKGEVNIRIVNRTEDGVFKERIHYEREGKEHEVEAEDGIELEENDSGSEYHLKARLRNGNETEIKIMPDRASQIAIDRLRALNFTIELREIEHKNIPRVVYLIESNKTGKFVGVFKIKVRVEGQIDPETGEFLGENKPWWAFLVSGEDSDQTGTNDNNSGSDTSLAGSPEANQNDTNFTTNTTINDTSNSS